MAYWAEQQSSHLFGFEEEELRPFFALPNVLGGLFGLCKRLFGVTILPATSSSGDASDSSGGGDNDAGSDGFPVWHGDVQAFKVVDDASGAHVASFYLDP